MGFFSQMLKYGIFKNHFTGKSPLFVSGLRTVGFKGSLVSSPMNSDKNEEHIYVYGLILL